MKYFILCIIGVFVLCPPASAQPEHWDTYIARFGNRPGSVLVDMGQINTAPDRRYPYLVITGPIAQKCDGQGLPDKEEIATLEDILSSTGNFLTGITAKVLVGTFTYNCERVNYYYVKDTPGIRTAMRRMYDRSYKNYGYAINIKYDPDWNSYRNFLYPDVATQNWMDNDKIVTQMFRDGDSLKTSRDINFDAYFSSDTARSAFQNFAQANGYKTVKLVESKSAPRSYAIIVSKHSVVTLDEVNFMTFELKKEAKKDKGTFTGWTAPAPIKQK